MSRHREKFLLFAWLGAGLIAAALVAEAGVRLIQGEPFRMTIRPSNGRAVVQFAQPDRRLITPEFPVDLPIEGAVDVSLISGKVDTPGCKVEFHDTTLLPGRFQIRIGSVLFDIMENKVIINEVNYDWIVF